MERFDRIPEKIKDKIFQKVFKIAEFHNLSPTDRQAYEDSLKYYRDLKNSLDTAELDGFAKAEQHFKPQLAKARKSEKEALKIAEEERRQKEEEKRQKEEAKLREEEARKKIIELAKFLMQMGVPTDQISEKTGLISKEISKLE